MPGYVTEAVAPSEQAAGAKPNGVQRVGTDDDPATICLMCFKEEIVLVKMGRQVVGQVADIETARSVKGGNDSVNIYSRSLVCCASV